MMKRRSVLKGIAGVATSGFIADFADSRVARAATTKVRVTLVRWPYT